VPSTLNNKYSHRIYMSTSAQTEGPPYGGFVIGTG
jgi:hypothetical protein